jgi:hypothetical protein
VLGNAPAFLDGDDAGARRLLLLLVPRTSTIDCLVKLSQLGAPLAAVNSELLTHSALAFFYDLVALWQTVPEARRSHDVGEQAASNVTDLMNASISSALAALAGAITGGLTSVLASWLTQHAQARAQWLAQDKLHRQELYNEFIEMASKCYIDALQDDKADTPALVELYVRVGRMRILSSPKVVESAELIARRIVDTYLEPNKTFLELREMANSGSIDLLRDFSETCRAEFESLRIPF